jgi:hypothetical protein
MFWLKNLSAKWPPYVDIGHSPSMHGVGIVLGIVAQCNYPRQISRSVLREGSWRVKVDLGEG